MTDSPRAAGRLGPGLSWDEVKEHNKPDDCWMIICGKVFDLTNFASEHPGGAGVVTDQAGKNATDPFLDAHPESIMKLTLGESGLADCYKGEIDMATVPDSCAGKTASATMHNVSFSMDSVGETPPLQAILNLHDFEAIAQRKMELTGKKQAWDYYSSGADDELTYNENVNSFQRIWLKPRVMVNVRNVRTSTTMLGTQAPFPVYLSAVAMCGMGHPEGEKAWMKASNATQIPFMIPNLSSKAFPDIVSEARPGQESWFQIYVNPDKNVVLDQLKELERHNIKALCITVDSAVPGKRERDLRNKIAHQLGQVSAQAPAAKGTKARKAGNYANRDPGLCWKDLEWFKANTSIPLVLKGIQTGEDAIIAAKSGCKGIILSNHGGRNLDTSRSGIEILPEVMAALKEEGLQNSIEVFVDGGIRRGTDILKALCLGAKGVGVGKPAVYSMSAYGSEGIEKMLDILQEELVKSMQLVGAACIEDLNPRMVNTDSLGNHTDVAPLPPSPFARVPAPKNVRTPSIEPARSRDDLAKEIATLQAQLDVMEGKRVTDSSSSVGVVAFFSALLKGVASTVFAGTVGGALHRSALLLYLYFICHALTNAAAFVEGEGTFANHVFEIVGGHPLALLVEGYLALGLVVHILAAAYFTSNKLGYIMRNPLNNGKLSISGTVILGFVYLHLTHFRLADIPNDVNGRTDFHAATLSLFADPLNLAIYVAGILSVVWHLQAGWPKTVLKMNLNQESRESVTKVGVALAYPVAALYCAIAIYGHLKAGGYIQV
ncbi:Cytochrome b2 [Diplonema papillatum]|nr:Cytochrome b2 [Diplonema papillatum]